MMSRSSRRSRFSVEDILTRTGAGIGMTVICLVTGCVRPYATRQPLTDVLRLETSIRATDLQAATKVRGEAKEFNQEFTWYSIGGAEQAEQMQGSIRVSTGHGDTVSIHPILCGPHSADEPVSRIRRGFNHGLPDDNGAFDQC